MKGGTAVLEVPEKTYASGSSKSTVPRRASKGPSTARDTSDDFARPARGSSDARYGQRFTGLRVRLRGGVPTSVAGRVIAGAVVLAGLASFTAVVWAARSSLLHDPRLVIASSSSIQIVGNRHLSRPQLLSVFGEDVERNLLTVPLEDRQAELLQLPWVEHATVMRLLPNHLRIAIVERVPVAFVRQGGHIGLVDKNGVLLDLSPEAASDMHYSFPVVTGVASDQSPAVRAARLKLYQSFLDSLDAGKEKISEKLSEVDLSSPEDVKALVPSGNSDILVHFGDNDFLARYLRFEQRLPEWKQQYPKLASADMRYEREVVLEMAPGNAVPVSAEEKAKTAGAAAIAAKGILGGKPVADAKAKLKAKSVLKAKTPVVNHPAAKAPSVPKAYVTPMHIHTPQQAGPQ